MPLYGSQFTKQRDLRLWRREVRNFPVAGVYEAPTVAIWAPKFRLSVTLLAEFTAQSISYYFEA